MITILIVDDHAPFLRSLHYMLESTEDLQVVATASNGMEAISKAQALCPDVAVVDISMPVMEGIETTRQITETCRFTRVMMLSIFDHSEYVQRALEVGAAGFVLKDTIDSDLLAAIRALAVGKHYFSHPIAAIAEQYFHRKGNDSWAA